MLLALADQRARVVVIQSICEDNLQGAVLARQGALDAVVQAVANHLQAIPAGDQAVVGVDHMPSLKAQLVGAEDDAAITVIDVFGPQGECVLTGDFPVFTVGQGDQTCKGQRAVGPDQTTPVVQIPALQVNGHGTLADQATLALNQLLNGEFQVALGRDFPAPA